MEIKFFRGLDEGVYWVLVFVVVFLFIGFLASWPSTELSMAKEGYVQKVEVVDVKKEVVIWVKEK